MLWMPNWCRFCQGWDGRIAESKQGQTLAGGAPDWQCSSSGPRTHPDTVRYPTFSSASHRGAEKTAETTSVKLRLPFKILQTKFQLSSTITVTNHESVTSLIFFHNAANLSTLL